MRVYVSTRPTVCGDCAQPIAARAWILLSQEKGTLCLSCADLAHLLYVPRMDVPLSTVIEKHSRLMVDLYQWNRYRKRHEPKGYLVDLPALLNAEEECLPDAEISVRRVQREAEWRRRFDRKFVERFAQAVRTFFPGCPDGEEHQIAAGACLQFGGTTGRRKPRSRPDELSVRMAVISYVRLRLTSYQELLASGYERWQARDAVDYTVNEVLSRWEQQVCIEIAVQSE